MHQRTPVRSIHGDHMPMCTPTLPAYGIAIVGAYASTATSGLRALAGIPPQRVGDHGGDEATAECQPECGRGLDERAGDHHDGEGRRGEHPKAEARGWPVSEASRLSGEVRGARRPGQGAASGHDARRQAQCEDEQGGDDHPSTRSRNSAWLPDVDPGMKNVGFLSFGHYQAVPGSQTRTAGDALLQTIELAVAAEELGVDGAFVRVHHFARQLASPFPLLAAIGARTSRIEIGTGVIDMRYENPLYMAEDAAAADLISGGRLQLGISRGSPETRCAATRRSATCPREGQSDADMARRAHRGVPRGDRRRRASAGRTRG